MAQNPGARVADLTLSRRLRTAARIAFSAALLLGSACGRDTPVTGVAFELQKPDSWTYVTATPAAARGNRIRFDAAQLDSALASGSADPLFALLKYPHPHPGMNPTLGVNVSRESELTGTDPAAYLSRLIEEAQHNSGKRFETLSAIAPTTVAGYPAARAVLGAAQDAGAIVPPLRLTILVVAVENTRFMIASSSPSAGEDESSGEFAQIIASIAFPTRE